MKTTFKQDHAHSSTALHASLMSNKLKFQLVGFCVVVGGFAILASQPYTPSKFALCKSSLEAKLRNPRSLQIEQRIRRDHGDTFIYTAENGFGGRVKGVHHCA
jgi:hypothetical protein